ncbi:unnamed protein product [Protopolystoma xenopodis]|uniref:Methionyl/Leucyl tRNA synthetase domain-containing protein n=1 Tax=Protopolystoma xenopodis TaxID=117903 RepID=A0A448X0U0_9PLAT|nr:unnamed protein product [Protopolystoma xenopodis]
MSKSLGNIIDPFIEEAVLTLYPGSGRASFNSTEIISATCLHSRPPHTSSPFSEGTNQTFDDMVLKSVVIPSDDICREGLRYVLLRCSALSADSDYSRKAAVEQINTELVNWLGNLLSSCIM